MSISVVFIAKNVIKQGYCFWESLSSCLPIANEIIIGEGFSTDDTLQYLIKFKKYYKNKVKINLFQEKWPDKSYLGEAIKIVSQNAIKKAQCEYVYYLQADEVIHEQNIPFIKKIASEKKYNSVVFPFHHFTRAWEPSKEGYRSAIRMIRNIATIQLMGDAWSFEGDTEPSFGPDNVPKPVYHFNWCFSSHNDIKDIEHARLYVNIPEYQEKMKRALSTLNKKKEPYPLTKFNDFPKITKRFIGKAEYILPRV